MLSRVSFQAVIQGDVTQSLPDSRQLNIIPAQACLVIDHELFYTFTKKLASGVVNLNILFLLELLCN